ncbi:unnamed protein product [Allacma fusca]|uniref:Cytochrome P450 n=1 Tax=Allacma fusca TaxID=39272 RepID=A0A8J2PTL5_9HEXA|nr:unnamed protein product [Allacma fusca]
MISLTGILVTGIIAIVVYSLFFNKDGKKYPKGPFAWPVIGNGFALKDRPEKTLIEWGKYYGDVFQIYFGKDRAYVVTDLKLAKELFNDTAFSARPNNELFHIFSEGPIGVLNSSGKVWLEQRRFTLRHLRDFGFVRYEQDDPRLWSIFIKNKELSELITRNPFLLFAPNIAKLFPKWSGWNQFLDLAVSMKTIVRGHVEDHRRNTPEDGVPRDFIDAYLKEIESTDDGSSSFYKDAGVQNLTAVIGDLFGAGFETVTLTVSWATLYLVRFQEIQKRFQAELDNVVGRNRFPALADRPLLPFVEATIAESMRLGTIVPLGLFHVADQDAKIRGFDVPKGTWLLCPLYGFHYDEKYFPNPEEFKPERFLSPDGKKFQKHEALVPFAFGKRACLGETLARDEVFLFLTNMFHRYSFIPAPENPKPSLEPTGGFTLAPQDYKVIVTERL